MPSYQFHYVVNSFLQHPGLPFADALCENDIEHAFDDESVCFGRNPDDVYTPAMTLWALLSQALFKNEQRSCTAAVARVITLLVALGRPPCSNNTGAYCRARAKVKPAVLRRLATQVADGCEQRVPSSWQWKGRRVHLVDGTTVSMPDTPANQAAYPQPTSQQQGLGFPILRMVVLLSLATALCHDMAIGPYLGKETGETALLRELLGRLQPGDVVLADRYYCSYFMIALLAERGVDVVARWHQKRKVDFREGARLGKGDRLDVWLKPDRPGWMDQAAYERMPGVLYVRKVRVHVHQRGCRTQSLVVATTLTDNHTDTKEDIAQLYHQRWLAEIDIRTIKITLGMDVLRCKSPALVQSEIWSGLLAYNLIRRTMLEAAQMAGASPRGLSFAAALQKIASCWMVIVAGVGVNQDVLIEVHLRQMANHTIGDRPDRVEPRAIKRRPKPHKLLTKPRDEARADLLTGVAREE